MGSKDQSSGSPASGESTSRGPRRTTTRGRRAGTGLSPRVGVNVFRGISILFPDDLYHLAWWLLQKSEAQSQPSCRRRFTVHGVAHQYSILTGIAIETVETRLTSHKLPLAATVDYDEDVS